MLTSRCVWTIVLLGCWFTDTICLFHRQSQTLPKYSQINCKTPHSRNLASTEEYEGTVENVTLSQASEIFLESPSCPDCVSFLELIHTVGDKKASVITRKPLDAEALKEHNGDFAYLSYDIVCTESGVRNSRTLRLSDTNDNPPVFEKDEYTVNISEDDPINTLVTEVKASDQDIASAYNTFDYSIETATTTFEIQPNGSIILKEQLNYNLAKLHNLTVKAEDKYGLSDETYVVIHVLKTQWLHFEQEIYNANITENEVGPFQSIHPGPIEASAGDQEIIYSISKVSPEVYFEHFAIENDTGVISVKKQLDKGNGNTINITIMASLKDKSLKTAYAKVVVSVADVNEPPVFSSKEYTAEIFSVFSVEDPVVEVKATDPDVGDTLQYSLVEPSSMFTVEPSSGQVYVVSGSGQSGKVILLVKATDLGGLYDTTTVEVTITYINPNNVVKISLNRPADNVKNNINGLKRAFEKPMSCTVEINTIAGNGRGLSASRSSTPKTYIDFIAWQGSVIMPKDKVHKTLKREREQILTELRAVFGPDVNFEIEDTPPETPWFTIMGILLGALAVLSCISLIVGGVMRVRGNRKRRDSMEAMPSFWSTGINERKRDSMEGMPSFRTNDMQWTRHQNTTEMQRYAPPHYHSGRSYR